MFPERMVARKHERMSTGEWQCMGRGGGVPSPQVQLCQVWPSPPLYGGGTRDVTHCYS